MPAKVQIDATQLENFVRRADEIIISALERWIVRVGARAVGSMNPGAAGHFRPAYPSPGQPLRIMSGTLARSLQGGSGSHREIRTGGGRYTASVGSDVPYANVHEVGASFFPSKRQRNFFWHKFMQSGDERWKAMALSDGIVIPSRPYLRPAADVEDDATRADVLKRINALVKELT